MGQNAQTDRSRRSVLTIDWMVLAVAVVAVLFLFGTMVRTSVEPGGPVGATELRLLGVDDSLLAFQDFSFEATGWSPSGTSDDLPGLGPVLGPFVDDAVQRSFAIPVDAGTARLTFDLHLLGDWAGQGDFHISVGEQEALTLLLPEPGTEGSDGIELEAVAIPGLDVFVDRQAVTPRPMETSLPGPDDNFVTLRIGMRVSDPPETLTLRLMAEAEGDASWTLDNLTVVATGGDSTR